MVQILFGDYGTGKSTYMLDKIKADYENKVRSFLIVPEQETVIKERQIASLFSWCGKPNQSVCMHACVLAPGSHTLRRMRRA